MPFTVAIAAHSASQSSELERTMCFAHLQVFRLVPRRHEPRIARGDGAARITRYGPIAAGDNQAKNPTMMRSEPRSARDRTEPNLAHDDFAARVTKWRAVPIGSKTHRNPEGQAKRSNFKPARRPKHLVRFVPI